MYHDHSIHFPDRGNTTLETFMDSRIEHRCLRNYLKCICQFTDQRICKVILQRNQQSGVGAKLSDAHRERTEKRFGQRRFAPGERAGQNDQRIDHALVLNRHDDEHEEHPAPLGLVQRERPVSTELPDRGRIQELARQVRNNFYPRTPTTRGGATYTAGRVVVTA